MTKINDGGAGDMTAREMLTKRQAAILGCFTGICFSKQGMSEIQELAEELLGRPVWTHEFASKALNAELKEAARPLLGEIVYDAARPLLGEIVYDAALSRVRVLEEALITIRDKRQQCNRAVDCQAVARAALNQEAAG